MGGGTLWTRCRLRPWHGEGKRGRDCGTRHQSDLQVFPHIRDSILAGEDTKSSPIATRNLTENPLPE